MSNHDHYNNNRFLRTRAVVTVVRVPIQNSAACQSLVLVHLPR